MSETSFIEVVPIFLEKCFLILRNQEIDFSKLEKPDKNDVKGLHRTLSTMSLEDASSLDISPSVVITAFNEFVSTMNLLMVTEDNANEWANARDPQAILRLLLTLSRKIKYAVLSRVIGFLFSLYKSGVELDHIVTAFQDMLEPTCAPGLLQTLITNYDALFTAPLGRQTFSAFENGTFLTCGAFQAKMKPLVSKFAVDAGPTVHVRPMKEVVAKSLRFPGGDIDIYESLMAGDDIEATDSRRYIPPI